jgi:hypothetical protein
MPVSRKVRRVVGAAIVVILVAGAISFWAAYRTARQQLSESRCDGHASFVQSDWMDTTMARGRLAVRGCMVDDLLERHELRGMQRKDVIALIGEPQPSDLFPEYDMVYWLGPERGLVGIDSEFLVMKVDKSGRVTSVELRTG